MTRILVTGGAGYIGSVLAEQLRKEGYTVRVADFLMYGYDPLSNMVDVELLVGDLRDQRFLNKVAENVDAVVHLASLTMYQCDKWRRQAEEINVAVTKNLYNRCLELGIPTFLFASSASLYGIRDEVATEESPLNPTMYYAELKAATETVLRRRINPIRTRCIVMRFATAYGPSPRMRWDLLLNQFVYEAWSKKRLDIFGPKQWRPIIHVEDLASAIILLFERAHALSSYYVVNVGSDNQNFMKQQLAEMVGCPYSIVDRSDPRSYRVSFQRLAALGFRPKREPKPTTEHMLTQLNEGKLSPVTHEIVEDLL